MSIDAQGQASYGPCSGPHSAANILPEVERPQDLGYFSDRYQPFEADIPAGRVVFVGRGTRVATSSEERALAEWASLVHQELQYGRSAASWGLAMALNQEGSNPCSQVQIEVYGKVFANDCRVGIQPYPATWLTAEQIDRLYAWMDEFQAFDMNWVKDGLPMVLVFGGQGDRIPSEADQRALLTWANELCQSIAQQGEGWQTYEDDERGFQFRYPEGRRVEVFDDWVGVGPEEMGEDVQWGVRFFDSSEVTLEQVISDIGRQFIPDRTEVRGCVYVDGIAAIKVSVTTSQIEDWYSESVVFEHQGAIFEIGNGAVDDERFRAFYDSFRLNR